MAKKDRVEVIHHAEHGWYWRRIAANGNELSRSSENYINSQHAIDQALKLNPGCEPVILEKTED